MHAYGYLLGAEDIFANHYGAGNSGFTKTIGDDICSALISGYGSDAFISGSPNNVEVIGSGGICGSCDICGAADSNINFITAV